MAMRVAGFLILIVLLISPLISRAQTVDENDNRIMSQVRFVGLDDNKSEGLLTVSQAYKVVRESGLKISESGVYDSAGVEKAVADLKQWLEQKGYSNAKIEVLQNPSPKNEKFLTFAIEIGAKERVAEIRFTGNKVFSDDELLATLKNCYKDLWETYDANFYDYCLRAKTRELATSKGYLKAEFGEPKVERTPAGFVLTIGVKEGNRYRFGKISIEGAKTFSSVELLEMFGQKSGEVADGKALRDFLFVRLKKLYADRGFLQYEFDVEPEYIEPSDKDLDGTVNLKIVLNEGTNK
jgi:outer membrane protein assembly factor BamA